MTAFFPTGTPVFDLDPCAGLPAGGVVHVQGGEGTGKTTLAMLAAAEVARCGWNTVYIDWLCQALPDYWRSLGVPLDDQSMFTYFEPGNQKQGLELALKLVSSGQVKLLVLDGGGVSPNVTGESVQQGLALWADQFPHIRAAASKTHTAVLVVTHARLGTSIKFLADRRIRLERTPYGFPRIQFTVEKDRFGPNHGKTGHFDLPVPP